MSVDQKPCRSRLWEFGRDDVNALATLDRCHCGRAACDLETRSRAIGWARRENERLVLAALRDLLDAKVSQTKVSRR